MKNVVAAIFIGMMSIATEVTAQLRPGVDQRQAVLNAQQVRLRQAAVNPQRIEQLRISQQRVEQLRIKQARIKHERIKNHRIKQARIKHARIKEIREDAADELGNQHPRRRYFHMMKRKRTAGQFNSENPPFFGNQ
ncbi:MAG: hypothetical protein HRU69_08050 [Flammeovirgaceae bacterium]|nr:MAG: hypothetical protein HRU69_08050 [Flammeovirgaceae bacterium]